MPESTERGALTEAVHYILISLLKPLHGYGIMQNVRALSGDRVSLGAGTLYGAINTMLNKGWIVPFSNIKNSRKKEYVITSKGIEIIKCEIDRLDELLNNGKNVIGGNI